jgi:hypothetical protein
MLKKGYIYKIVSPSIDKCYIGSTLKDIKKRLQKHKHNYTDYIRNNAKKYMSSFEIIKYNDYTIELLEEIEFENIKELRYSEGCYILHNNCINKMLPCRRELLQEYI